MVYSVTEILLVLFWLLEHEHREPKISWDDSLSHIMAGVPRGWEWGLVLFKIFVGDVDTGAKCTLSKFANDTKLCSREEMPSRGTWTCLKGGALWS